MSIVHALHQGQVLCRSSIHSPNDWPEEHLWAPLRNIESVTCKECLSAATTMGPVLARGPLFSDEWTARETEQELLYERIILSLHSATSGDEDRLKIFGGIAQIIIWVIVSKNLNAADNPVNPHASNEMLRAATLFREKVDIPTHAFAGPDNEPERKFLLGALLVRLIVNIRIPSSSAYNAKMTSSR